jgi:hypothetical protein
VREWAGGGRILWRDMRMCAALDRELQVMGERKPHSYTPFKSPSTRVEPRYFTLSDIPCVHAGIALVGFTMTITTRLPPDPQDPKPRPFPRQDRTQSDPPAESLSPITASYQAVV